uniref:Uncharacterized protein n=1 Tax=Physcomitrium patens TaxID=3218 RepID=A0A2K1JK77_PHYPA|nr:hypothetical protein PHYPA_016797 [Physcomitrium patens]
MLINECPISSLEDVLSAGLEIAVVASLPSQPLLDSPRPVALQRRPSHDLFNLNHTNKTKQICCNYKFLRMFEDTRCCWRESYSFQSRGCWRTNGGHWKSEKLSTCDFKLWFLREL